MKHKWLAYAALPVLGVGLASAGMASAHGFGFGFMGMSNVTPDQIASNQVAAFQNIANLLGLSVDDVKNGWAQGKSISQIAQDHGITLDQLKQKMKDAQTAKMKILLKTLVEKGVITQAQADQRLQFLQNMQTTTGGKGRMGRGFRGWFGF